MVTHIVFFVFHPDNKAANLIEAKRRIEAMIGSVPTLRTVEAGINFSQEERAMDMALIARFDDREGLEAYATHPVHQEVVAWIKTVAEQTRVVDYDS